MDLSVHCDGFIAYCNEAIEGFTERYYDQHGKPRYITNEFISDCEKQFMQMLKDYPISRVIYSWLKQHRNLNYDVDYSEYEDDDEHIAKQPEEKKNETK